MGLETGTVINDFNPSWPLGSDPKAQGDDHLRLIKQILQDVWGALGDDTLQAALDANVAGLVEEAPEDSTPYIREDAGWLTPAAAGLVEEAPEDGTPYERQDAGWVQAPTIPIAIIAAAHISGDGSIIFNRGFNSIVRQSTGRYDYTFPAIANVEYTIVSLADHTDGNNAICAYNTPTATSFQIYITNQNNNPKDGTHFVNLFALPPT